MRRTDRLCFSVAIAAALMLLGGGNAVAVSPQGAPLRELLDRLDALETDLATTNAALSAAEARIAVLESAQVQWGDIQNIPAGFLDGVDDVGSSVLDGFVSVDFGPINGVAGPHIIFTGANVHVRSGGLATDDGGGALTGLGNLIVGYNSVFFDAPTRTGSHNLVVGDRHSYTSHGGFVAGFRNNIIAPYASVSGGKQNTASGFESSVSGGAGNTASGLVSSVSGGQNNEASGIGSSVSGGIGHEASGNFSSVSGGTNNTASAFVSSVSGGQLNEASGGASSVSGGVNRAAPGTFNWVAGGLFQSN